MWFKQVSVFQLQTTAGYNIEKLTQQLAPLSFTPCLPSLPVSQGWAPPVEENADMLIRSVADNYMLCLQVEEKILPTSVIQQAMQEKVKMMEAIRDRKVSAKEKRFLREEATHTLLPRAFSKLSRIYGYINTSENWLIIDSTQSARVSAFTELLQRTCSDIRLQLVVGEKIQRQLTRWLIDGNYPDSFAIEKSCVLNNPRQKTCVVRCQQQDLSAHGIQYFVKEGYEAQQLALSWQDRLDFVLSEDFTLKNIRFRQGMLEQNEEVEKDNAAQTFDVDFLIMGQTLVELIKELTVLFLKTAEHPLDSKIALSTR